MVHGALDVTIPSAIVQPIGELEGNHIAIVAIVLGDFFLHIAAHHFRLVGKRMLTERMLGIEGDAECRADAIVTGEIPRGSLMTTMLTLHEVPAVVCVCSECPAT